MHAPKVPAAILATLITLRLNDVAANQVISSLTDLPFDKNGHLASHVLAYPATDPCASLIETEMRSTGNLFHHIPFAVEGEAATALFGDRLNIQNDGDIKDVTDCPAVCLDRGVNASLVAYTIPQNYFNPVENDDHSSISGFVGSTSCGRVEFG